VNLWSWVYAEVRRLRGEGQGRLADLIDELPGWVCADAHARVDAAYPEALALARASRNPWLEVFVRHWYLQSRVLHRGDVTDTLPEAVHLLELAHRDENLACPQGVCATQDLVNCYERIDGPGYATERLSACRDTLERIDARWPCYQCVGGEELSALVDAGRLEDALSRLQAYRGELVAHNVPHATRIHGLMAAELHIARGDYERALDEAEHAADRKQGPGKAACGRLFEALAFAHLGRFDEARARLVEGRRLLELQRGFRTFASTLQRLASDPAHRFELDDLCVLLRMQELRERYSNLHDAFQLAIAAGRIAIALGHVTVARWCQERATARAHMLRGERRGAVELETFARDLAGLHTRLAGLEVPPDPQTWRAWLSSDSARMLDQLAVLEQRSPDLEWLVEARARAWLALGRPDVGLDALRQRVAAAPRDMVAIATLVEIYLELGEPEALERELSVLADTGGGIVELARGRIAAIQGDLDRARKHFAAAAMDPDCAVASWRHAAAIARRRGDFTEALRLLGDVVAASVASGPDDWDRLSMAAMVGDLEAYQDSARRLGLAAGGEIGSQQAPATCRIRMSTLEHDSPLLAKRTGPVTAQILQIVGPRPGPGPDEAFLDHVVFDAKVRNAASLAEDAEAVPVFDWIGTLRPGGMKSFDCEGAHPGDLEVERIRKAFSSRRFAFSVRSGAGYRVQVDGRRVPGIYAVFAVPVPTVEAELHAWLATLTGRLPHPFAWVSLARATGDPSLLRQHLQILEGYGLEA